MAETRIWRNQDGSFEALLYTQSSAAPLRFKHQRDEKGEPIHSGDLVQGKRYLRLEADRDVQDLIYSGSGADLVEIIRVDDDVAVFTNLGDKDEEKTEMALPNKLATHTMVPMNQVVLGVL